MNSSKSSWLFEFVNNYGIVVSNQMKYAMRAHEMWESRQWNLESFH